MIPEPIYVARQPVFDRDMDIWGYELLFRHSAQCSTARIDDADEATSRVIADGFGLVEDLLAPSQKVLINYPGRMLVQGAPRALPSDVAIVEILETVQPTPEILRICAQLKAEGYVLALDDFVGQSGFEALLQLADLVKVDVLYLNYEQLKAVVGNLRRIENCRLLAEKVEDLAMYDQCRELGFDLFQGYFFSRPELVSGKKLSANQISKLQLLKELSAPDLELIQVAKIVQHDVALSYRLLRYINSPGFGLPNEITSINQAMNLLGQRKVTAWLRVLIMAEMKTNPLSGELLFLSLQRAKLLEALQDAGTPSRLSSEGMFLLGLFSFLDVILGLPMNDILARLSLGPCLKAALLGRDAELQAWLDLAEACERGNWDKAEALLKGMNLGTEQTAKILNESALWAKQFLDVS
ncbi:EAL and modified HD-GYP domain-containing signal transduction protein [Desulfonatronum thiosulfatophilum]|uniref:EAL and modified HD-GYP domain-containing signal transduction protein n=1 Tax=Desulfonatronum thiosulfatophilum TaxID=617002 RepID=A0A1G6CH44_9BACT|nr:HDOD domain-containing protein [Desulfonatronum thiosulfatophilum]SDB32125.1 EAL and modified HD-GYP domain-containing signal transduction protein [Desulfonatronum thiosulfatophilum]